MLPSFDAAADNMTARTRHRCWWRESIVEVAVLDPHLRTSAWINVVTMRYNVVEMSYNIVVIVLIVLQ